MEHLKHFYRKQNFGFFFTLCDYIFDLSLLTALLDIHQKSCEKLQKFLGSNRLFLEGLLTCRNVTLDAGE